MFTVHLFNFNQSLPTKFPSLESAIEAGKSTGFEFFVQNDLLQILATGGPIQGVRIFSSLSTM